MHAAGGRGLRAALDQRLERDGAVTIVIADVETRPRLARNQIDGFVADIDRGEFEMRRIEMGAAFIERRLQRGNERDEPADRVVGAMGIGDVTLTAS